MRCLLLSTYPNKGSRNSGDELIATSLIALIKDIKENAPDVDILNISKGNTLDKDLNKIVSNYQLVISPAIRPMIKHSDFQLRSNILKAAYQNEVPIFAVGAGWEAYPGSLAQSKKLLMDEMTIKLFKNIFNSSSGNSINVISARDTYTENLLTNNGIHCYGTTGDCALFDVDYLKQPVRLPEKINDIAISMPHNKHHYEDAFRLAKKLQKKYSCNVYITYHGYMGSFKDQIDEKWINDSIEFVDLSGCADNLNFYNKIDVHIGFRLHAHIWFLRTRKPSLLIAESGRSSGHLATIKGLGYLVPPKIAQKIAEVFPHHTNLYAGIVFKNNKISVNKIVELFEQEHNSGYPTTKASLEIVDRLWEEKMKPLIKSMPE